jgi:hypothetical protein
LQDDRLDIVHPYHLALWGERPDDGVLQDETSYGSGRVILVGTLDEDMGEVGKVAREMRGELF